MTDGKSKAIEGDSLISEMDLQSLRAEVSHLENKIRALAETNHRRRLEVQLDRLKERLPKPFENADHAQQTEKELERFRAISQALVEQIPVAFVVVEAPSGKVLYSNRHLELLMKEPVPQTDSIEQYDQFGAFHPDGRPFAAEEYPLARAILEDRVVTKGNVYYRCPDGEVRTLHLRGIPVRNSQGEVVAALGLAFDVTNR